MSGLKIRHWMPWRFMRRMNSGFTKPMLPKSSYMNRTSTPSDTFFQQNLFDPVEDFRIFHGKIFHENKFPCIFQILQHGFQGWLCLRIVDYIRIPVYRIAAGVLNIIFLVMDINIFFFRLRRISFSCVSSPSSLSIYALYALS
mgnify:CR=1 FL=1